MDSSDEQSQQQWKVPEEEHNITNTSAKYILNGALKH